MASIIENEEVLEIDKGIIDGKENILPALETAQGGADGSISMAKGIDIAAAAAILSSRKICEHSLGVGEGIDHSHSPRPHEIDEEPPFLRSVAGDETTDGPLLVMPTSVTGCVHEFHKCQELRVKVYKIFESSFNDVLETKYFADYSLMCKLVTSGFQYISQHINKLETILRAENEGLKMTVSIANIFRKIQKLEQEKLHLTIKLQVYRQKQEVFVVVREGTDYTSSIDELQFKLTKTVAAINEHLEELKYWKADLIEIEKATAVSS